MLWAIQSSDGFSALPAAAVTSEIHVRKLAVYTAFIERMRTRACEQCALPNRVKFWRKVEVRGGNVPVFSRMSHQAACARKTIGRYTEFLGCVKLF